MGLMKDCNFWPGAYHKIVGVEISRDLQRVVIRTVISPAKNTPAYIDKEYRIKAQTFAPLMRARAESLINAGAIRKQVEVEIKKHTQEYISRCNEINKQQENDVFAKIAAQEVAKNQKRGVIANCLDQIKSLFTEQKIDNEINIPLNPEIRKQVWEKTDRDNEIRRLTENAIVTKMAELGIIEMQNQFALMNERGILFCCYNILKLLPEFRGAIDA